MKKILLLTALVLTFAGCTNNDMPTVSDPIETPEPQTTIVLTTDTQEFDDMTLYEECEYDVTGTGDETIELLTDAIKGEDNEFYWDDSHDWALIVKTNDGAYPLYHDHAHGELTLNMREFYEEDGNVVPVICLTISSSAGFEIREYRFSDNAFVENVVYKTGAINEIPVEKY